MGGYPLCIRDRAAIPCIRDRADIPCIRYIWDRAIPCVSRIGRLSPIPRIGLSPMIQDRAAIPYVSRTASGPPLLGGRSCQQGNPLPAPPGQSSTRPRPGRPSPSVRVGAVWSPPGAPRPRRRPGERGGGRGDDPPAARGGLDAQWPPGDPGQACGAARAGRQPADPLAAARRDARVPPSESLRLSLSARVSPPESLPGSFASESPRGGQHQSRPGPPPPSSPGIPGPSESMPEGGGRQSLQVPAPLGRRARRRRIVFMPGRARGRRELISAPPPAPREEVRVRRLGRETRTSRRGPPRMCRGASPDREPARASRSESAGRRLPVQQQSPARGGRRRAGGPSRP